MTTDAGSGAAPTPSPRNRLTATSADLPADVAAALAAPGAGTPGWIEAGGIRWATMSWGAAGDPPILLLHGVTSNSAIWWRVGPALAAAGRHVIAIDMPGHGKTQGWQGRHRFIETAEDVAGFVRAAGLDRPDLAVIGHSWGAMVAAHLPAAGIRPREVVLLDPPALTVAQFEVFAQDPTEQPYPNVDAAAAAMRTANPTWSDGDIAAKALSLTEFNPDAVLAVLLENGDWDAAIAGSRTAMAAGVPVWIIRGEWATGCLIPDALVPRLESELGRDHVITIRNAPHSPQRTHPEATVLAMLRALGPARDRSAAVDGGGGSRV
ncbi:MAG: alpha/beta hydrolase [Chloroflexota bacterium]